MSDSHILGRNGEEIAAEHLKKAGYSILFRNWKWGRHEIDIIAANSNRIIFVEVKTRSEGFLVHPAAALTREKQKSIILAAEGYVKRYKIEKESRFDLITIIAKGETCDIEHVEDVFYPTLR